MMNDYEVLGQVARDLDAVLGASVDPSLILSTAGEIAQSGIRAYDTQQAKNKAEAALRAQGEKVVAADAAWASAEAALFLAQKSGDAGRISAAQMVVQAAQQGAAMASSGAPPELVQKRLENAQANAQRAAAEALSAPQDATKAARAQGWQRVAQGAMSFGAPFGGGYSGGGQMPSFLVRKFGGLPVWGWGLGTILVGTGLYFILRRRS
jgi:hypothetical protein